MLMTLEKFDDDVVRESRMAQNRTDWEVHVPRQTGGLLFQIIIFRLFFEIIIYHFFVDYFTFIVLI